MNYDITFCSKRNCTDKEFENLIDNTGHLKTFIVEERSNT